MLAFILSTTYLYKVKISRFISNSVEHTFVVSSEDLTEKNKLKIEKKLKDLTYQEVVIEQVDDVVYVKIKCPPDKFSFFSKLISDRKWSN